MDLNSFKTNKDLSEEGVWCPVDDVTRIKVARYGNNNYSKAFKREMAPYKRLVDQGNVSNEVADKILCRAFVEGVLLDWDGMTKDGEPYPYTKENALALLLDPQFKDFRSFVTELSQDIELFREQEVADAAEK